MGLRMNLQHFRKRRLSSGQRGLAIKLAALAVASAAVAAPAASAVQAQGIPPVARNDAYLLQLPLTFSPWVKLCNKDVHSAATRVCVTVTEGRSEHGDLAVTVAIIETGGEQRKLFRLRMPYGVALRYGTQLFVDQSTPAMAPFETCLPPVVPPGGCLSDYEASVDLVGRLKSGQRLTVQATNMNGQIHSIQIELKDFAQVYESPGTEPFAEQQKKLEDELRKRQPRPRLN
jgi:invasion protein IalB